MLGHTGGETFSSGQAIEELRKLKAEAVRKYVDNLLAKAGKLDLYVLREKDVRNKEKKLVGKQYDLLVYDKESGKATIYRVWLKKGEGRRFDLDGLKVLKQGDIASEELTKYLTKYNVEVVVDKEGVVKRLKKDGKVLKVENGKSLLSTSKASAGERVKRAVVADYVRRNADPKVILKTPKGEVKVILEKSIQDIVERSLVERNGIVEVGKGGKIKVNERRLERALKLAEQAEKAGKGKGGLPAPVEDKGQLAVAEEEVENALKRSDLTQEERDLLQKAKGALSGGDKKSAELKRIGKELLKNKKLWWIGLLLVGLGGLLWWKSRGSESDEEELADIQPSGSATPASKAKRGATGGRARKAPIIAKATGSPVEENELKRKDEVEDPAKAIAYGISTASRITLDYGLPRKYRGKNYIGGVNGLTTGYDVWRTAFTLYSYGMALKNDEGLKEKVIERVAKDLAEREGLSDKEAYKKAKALVERFIATTTSDRYRKSLIEKEPAKVKYNKSLRDAIMYFQEMGRHALAGEDVFVPEGADMSDFAYEKMHVDGYFGAESLSAAVAFGRLLAQFREGEKPQQPQEEESTEEEEGQRREEEEAEKKELAAFLGTLSERQPKEALLSLRGFSQEDYDRLLSAEGWEQAEGRWYKKVGPYTFQYDPTISTLNVYTNDPRKVSGEPILTLTRVASGWDVVWHDEGYKRKGGAEGGVVERTPIHPTQKGVKGYWELIREMGYYRAEERLAENTTVYIPVEYVSDDVIYAAKKGKTFPHRLGEDIPLKKAIRVELVERNGKQYIKVNAKDLINFDGEHAKAFFNEKGQEVIKNALKGSRNIEKSPDFKETIMWKLGRIDWGRSYRSLIKGITAMGGDVVVNSPTTFRGKEYGELIFRYAGGNYFLEGVSTSTGGGGEVAPLTTPSSQASTQVQRNEGQERTQQEGTQEGQREELAVKASIRDNKLYLEIDGIAVEQALEEEWGKTLSKALGEWRKKAGDNYGILANVSLPTTEEWEPYGNVVCWGSACTTILRKGDTLYAVYFLKRGNTVEVETQEVPSQLLS